MTNIDIRTLGTVINSIIFMFALFMAFKYILETRKNTLQAFMFVVLMTFGAYSFYFSALYTESLFLILLVSAFYALHKKNYILMGIAGALLSSTRNMGVFFVFAVAAQYVADYLKGNNKSLKMFFLEALQNSRLILGVSLIPLGLFSYMFYLWKKVGDPMAFTHIQRAWERELQNPLEVWYNGITSGYSSSIYLALWALLGLCCIIILIRNKRWSEAIMGIIFLFVPISTAMDSIPRYLVGSFVFILAMTDFLAKRKSKFFNIGFVSMYMVYEIWLLMLWFGANPIMT